MPRLVGHWYKPVVIARHGFGDQHRATELRFEGPGTIRISFQPADAGVAMSMFNLDVSIKGFARACVNYGLSRNYPVYLSTKNIILKGLRRDRKFLRARTAKSE